MTDNVAVRKDRWLGWTVAIAGGAGLYFGLTSHNNPEPLIKPVVASLLVALLPLRGEHRVRRCAIDPA